MDPRFKRLSALTLLAAFASAYQFDSAPAPTYPIILPTPRNMTFGNATTVIDPCFFLVTAKVTFKEDPSSDDFQGYIQDFITNRVFYAGSDCQ